MDNIDKTFILSYPRTGSTALLDVYRLYLENAYPGEYLNMPSEPMEADQFFNLTDYKKDRYPFHKFCKKHNIPLIEVINLLDQRESLDMDKIGDSIFKAILSEKYFATKIFPHHINYYPQYMKEVLLKHKKEGNNLICLYRKNFLDTLSSMITCTWSKQWVSCIPRHQKTLITADMVEIKNNFKPISDLINSLKIWHSCFRSILECNKDIKLVAYEDINNFNSDLLFDLHNVKTNLKLESRVKVQHDKEQQRLVIEKYKYLIDQVLTKEVMKDLPLNSSYEVIP